MDNAVELFKNLLYNHSVQMDFLVEKCEGEEYLRNLNEIITALCHSLKNHGKIILVGCGKTFKIAKKTVALLQSLGLRSTYLHPTEALHGDMGCIKEQDSLLLCSTSGETEEVILFLKYLIEMETWPEDVGGGKVLNKISVCANPKSSLSVLCDNVVQVPQKFSEDEIQDGLRAPTVSTTSMLVVLDCLCIALSNAYYDGNTQRRNIIFNRAHPAGGIGKKAKALKSSESAPSLEPPVASALTAKLRPAMTELEVLQTLILHDWIVVEPTLQLPSKTVQLHYKIWSAQRDVEGANFCNYLKSRLQT